VLVGSDEANEEWTVLTRALLMRMLRTLPEPLSAPPTKNYRVTRILGYLEEQFADAMVCLASAARHVGVTPPHLDRLLKDHTGLPFLQHLRRIRMRYAERLLLLTNSSIKETAYACGYVASGSFGRDFKRTHGCAARAWRAKSTVTSVRELKEAQSRAR
jgi:AraC-like DNA-binding protein